MSKYTTGELARLAGVSVRTVQYYDERGILIPSETSEGGRRLFSEEDRRKLESICFLRDIDMPIKDIRYILESSESRKVIEMLLEQQVNLLKKEIGENEDKLKKIKKIKENLVLFQDASEDSIHDISGLMQMKKELFKMYRPVLIFGILMDLAEVAAFVYGIMKHEWIPFFILLVLLIIPVCIMVKYMHENVAYICPECHLQFKPGMKEYMFAKHTLKTRRCTCPQCCRKLDCIEVLDRKEKKE